VINKKRIFEILEIASAGDITSKIFDVFIMTLISLNVIAVILETEPSLASYKRFLIDLKYSQ
jgi:voltage-gated potassium channel